MILNATVLWPTKENRARSTLIGATPQGIMVRYRVTMEHVMTASSTTVAVVLMVFLVKIAVLMKMNASVYLAIILVSVFRNRTRLESKCILEQIVYIPKLKGILVKAL